MKVHNLGKFPEGMDYGGYEMSDLSEWDFERIEKLGVVEIWYWYATGYYCGTGDLLMRKGKLFDHHSMSHCSCYGPTEEVDFHGKPFKTLKESCSNELMNEVKELFKMAEPSAKKMKSQKEKA
jgi:hypothetical protein